MRSAIRAWSTARRRGHRGGTEALSGHGSDADDRDRQGFGPSARADLLGKGVITAATLHARVSERVKELTRGAQHPVMVLPQTMQDFPMFIARR